VGNKLPPKHASNCNSSTINNSISNNSSNAAWTWRAARRAMARQQMAMVATPPRPPTPPLPQMAQ